MNTVPFYTSASFVLTTFLAIFLFYRASNRNIKCLLIIIAWLITQSAIGVTGFFTKTNTLPPRLILLIALPLAAIVIIFSTARGRSFINGFDIKALTLLHTIRIPVEMILFSLFLHKLMPQLMTFEGRNFDLISGVTAPLIYYFGFKKQRLRAGAILTWNFICLLILLFTVSIAILSAPSPFQKFAFDQPAIAVLYFPFVWLPGIVVPLVIFSQLISIRFFLKEVTSNHKVFHPQINFREEPAR